MSLILGVLLVLCCRTFLLPARAAQDHHACATIAPLPQPGTADDGE